MQLLTKDHDVWLREKKSEDEPTVRNKSEEKNMTVFWNDFKNI